jgi:hypothetical protein
VTPRYIRKRPESKEEVAAGLISAALGVAVGVVAFYFVRMMLAREPLPGSSGSSPDAPRADS